MKQFKEIVKQVFIVSKKTKVGKKKIRIFLSIILSNLGVLADILIILFFTNLLVGEITDIKIVNQIIKNIYLLPLLIVFRFLNSFAQTTNIVNLQLNIEKNIKVYLLEEIYKKGNYSIADSTYFINTLSGHIGYFYGALSNVINGVIQVAVYSSFLFYTNLSTVSVFLGGAFILFFPIRTLLVLARKYMHEAWENGQIAQKDIQSVIENIFIIKILNTTIKELQNFKNTIDKVQEANQKNQIFGTINSLLPNFTTGLTISILIIFFGLLKTLTLDFLGVTLRMVQTIGSLINHINMMINSHIHLEKFIEIDKDKLVIPNNYYVIDKEMSNAIEIKDLNFTYFNSSEKIFNKLNLNIPKDQHVVITGENGSGKSTLLGLIAKVFYPQSGEIKLNTDSLGYVGVTPLIFRASLRENILYGNNYSISDNEIMDLVEEFELYKSDNFSLEDEVSNTSLSSGQMQKIAFMRALLNKNDLLLLDESTSNLDIETKKMIFDILNLKKITILNSTHNYEDFNYDKHLRIISSKNDRKVIELEN